MNEPQQPQLPQASGLSLDGVAALAAAAAAMDRLATDSNVGNVSPSATDNSSVSSSNGLLTPSGGPESVAKVSNMETNPSLSTSTTTPLSSNQSDIPLSSATSITSLQDHDRLSSPQLLAKPATFSRDVTTIKQDGFSSESSIQQPALYKTHQSDGTVPDRVPEQASTTQEPLPTAIVPASLPTPVSAPLSEPASKSTAGPALAPTLESLPASSITAATVVTPIPDTVISSVPSKVEKELEPKLKQEPKLVAEPPVEYPIDAGIIRCICGFDDDDGFTIQCEKCNAWQHAQCVDIADEAQVPDIYYCDQCSDRTVDVQLAIERQTKRIQESVASAKKKKQRSRSRKENRTDGSPDTKTKTGGANSPKVGDDASNAPSSNVNSAPSENTPAEGTANTPGPATVTFAPNLVTTPNNDHDDSNEQTASSTDNTKRGRRKRQSSQESLNKMNEEAASISVNNSTSGHNTPIPRSPVVESDTEQDDNKFYLEQNFKCQFVAVTENRIVSESVRKYIESIPSLSHLDEDSCSFLTGQEFAHIKPAKVSVRPTSDQSKQKFMGFSKFGLFLESGIQRHRFVIEHFGEIMFQRDYKSNPVNQYRLFGCPKPGVLFVPSLDIAIDSRRIGSEAGFIRNSCKPNIKFSTIVVEGNTSHVHFAAFALEPIKAGTELTVGWDWDPKHPVHKISGDDSDSLSIEERQFLVRSSKMIQQRGIECACKSGADCVLTKMKKAGLGGPRSTRLGKKSLEQKQLQLQKQQLQQKQLYGLSDSSIDALGSSSPLRSPSTPATPLYSAREERKIQGAMSLIEKMEQRESAKRKRTSASGDDGTGASNKIESAPVSGDEGGTVNDDEANSSILSNSTAEMNNRSSSPISPIERSVPPGTSQISEPASKKHKLDEPVQPLVVTPRQKKLARYLLAKQEYISQQRTRPRQYSPVSPSSLSRFSGSPPSPSRGKFVGSLPHLAITNNIGAPGVLSVEQTPSPLTPRTFVNGFHPAPPVSTGTQPMNGPIPAASSNGNGAVSTSTGLGIGVDAPPQKPTVKKKLSFADYRKKQKPPSTGTNLSSTISSATTPSVTSSASSGPITDQK
ncbi:histone-binding protein SET3 [Sugiyamaella lignohabitans]|uniref:Histone-binding protein SET3 n=1 Tax=Sugiyamaella lignohabitans TaxID=796027 RepID=A0A167FBW1_9ASCO|nr:histone-binding protein SET3 [Sugiyamaella lignohabitans]ANB15088.1 histone-binding protein SET3 [Sugiyamaella lignohabitans]